MKMLYRQFKNFQGDRVASDGHRENDAANGLAGSGLGFNQIDHSQGSHSRLEISHVQSSSQVPGRLKLLNPIDALCIFLPVLALSLWAISLQQVSVYAMNDLGLISVLSPRIVLALVILTVSFGIAVQRPLIRVPVLALHLLFVILILYGTQNLVEQAPRFAIVYRHAGYTEYIMRTGSVNPNLDAYFSWTGFFILSAFVTQVAGYQSILSYAGWAPVFYNLIYFGPMYMIFASATTNKRLIWLGLWVFYLTNWVGQDYFSPQGLNLFLYLVIIAIFVKWFKISANQLSPVRGRSSQPSGFLSQTLYRFFDWLKAPDPSVTTVRSWQSWTLLASLILIFGLVIYSHPLTPFFVFASVSALAIFRRCRPFWLPILMVIMNAAWIFFMARTFLVGHVSMVVGNVGNLGRNVSASVTSRAQVGDPEHRFVALLRVVMTGFVGGLALLGGIRRLGKGYQDITYVLLVGAPIFLIAAQNYGGELSLRIYLFALPILAFFAAALFYNDRELVIRKTSWWMTIAIILVNLTLLSGFLFTRYGNERVDYITYAEFDGMQHLYSIAPSGSLFIEGWDGAVWQYKDYEKYSIASLTESPDIVKHADVEKLVRFIKNHGNPHTYLIFTRAEKAELTAYDGSSNGVLDRLETAMLISQEFKLVYKNADTQIFVLAQSVEGGQS